MGLPWHGDREAGGLVPLVTGMACGIATFVNFLIFAQFGYLERLRELGFGSPEIQACLGVMGLAGLVTSLLAPLLFRWASPLAGLRLGLAASLLVIVGATATDAPGFGFLTLVSAGIGFSIALTTVSLQSVLQHLFDGERAGLRVGLGTGLAYLICNVPWLFEASPAHKGAFVGAVQLVALVSTLWLCEFDRLAARSGEHAPDLLHEPRGFVLTVGMFLGIIWLDSAAFYIIQSTPRFRSQLWGTADLQWQNSACHLVAALVGGWLIDRQRLPRVLAAAYVVLVAAVLLMQSAGGIGWLVAICYVSAVSIYSTGLSAYGILGARARGAIPVHWRVGILFAVAGWMGSALGVGMAQDLREVPTWFMAIAGLVIAAGVLPLVPAVSRATGARCC